jgi:hypothetical protein
MLKKCRPALLRRVRYTPGLDISKPISAKVLTETMQRVFAHRRGEGEAGKAAHETDPMGDECRH